MRYMELKGFAIGSYSEWHPFAFILRELIKPNNVNRQHYLWSNWRIWQSLMVPWGTVAAIVLKLFSIALFLTLSINPLCTIDAIWFLDLSLKMAY